MRRLRDILTTHQDLPVLQYSLASWTGKEERSGTASATWDSLDYYTLNLYSNTEYKTRKTGFTMIVNSALGHLIDQDLLKKITVYYTNDSDRLDFLASIDDRCQWNAIPFLNQYQGSFKTVITRNDFNTTLLRNEASGRFNTSINEIAAKKVLIEKARILLKSIHED